MTKYLLLLMLCVSSCKEDKNDDIQNISDAKIKNGKYKFYKKNGELDKVLEYINLCGTQYLNQGWYFKNNMDTLFGKSNFYKISVEKSILKSDENSRIIIKYKPFMKNSISVLLLGNKNIDDNFCNLAKIRLDTLYFVDNKLEFNQSFRNKGTKMIGGYIIEFKKVPEKINNHNVYDERRVYFKIPFEVK
ncbi:hypothetical protein [Flavobacterium sp. '19STA2R22 D10 B1']|uniref:hypothetical protein n=1 Tax=Flavobacterium aerium TaxID=3037261 RepID=UPI00278C65CA|nr:hypothetical protein [Flavobacterium sp. '19STA2R22 D10 B1']